MTTDKDELKVMLKVKMMTFCKLNNIRLYQFLDLVGITKQTWFRIYSGKDTYFSSIVKLVEESNGYFTYDEFAQILDDEYLVAQSPEKRKFTIKKIVEKRIGESEFGEDPSLDL